MSKIKGWSVVPVSGAVKIRGVNINIGGVMGRDGQTIPSRIEYRWKNRGTILYIRSYSGKTFDLSFRTSYGMFSLGTYTKESIAFERAIVYMKSHTYGARRI
jgi:hypothetical protein